MDGRVMNSLYEQVWQKTAELVGIPVEKIDRTSTLESLGLDSSDAVVLALELEQATGQTVDVGVFLRFETIEEAAQEVERLFAGDERAQA
jgi:acyl carrier protein